VSARTAVLALLTAVPLLSLTGCGGSGGATTTTDTTVRVADERALVRVLAASERLAEAGTFAFAGTMRGTTDAMPLRITMRGVTTTTGAPAVRATARTTIGKETVPAEIVVRGRDVFMRLPEEARVVDTPWMRERLSADELLTGDMAAGARLTGQADEAWRVGRERVDGRPTTRYRVSIDVRHAAEHGPADIRTYARAVLRVDPRDRQSEDVWIDDAGNVRRTTSTLPDEDGGLSRIDVRILRTGVPVSTWTPPADQVSDAPPDDDPA
jgi:hypothetical protein